MRSSHHGGIPGRRAQRLCPVLGWLLWRQRTSARRDAPLTGLDAWTDATAHERVGSLFQHHPHAVCALDLQGRLVDVNPACERLTG